MTEKHILVATSEVILNEGMCHLLAEPSACRRITSAYSMSQVMHAVHQQTYDVIVLAEPSFDLPLSFIARRIHEARPDLRIVALHRGPVSVAPSVLFRHGAYAVLCDDYSASEFLLAVRQVESGKLYISETVAECLACELHAKGALHLMLSDRQAEVLFLLVRGFSVKDIAERLLISNTMVSQHSAAIRRLLKVGTKSELIRYAIEHCLIESSESCS